MSNFSNAAQRALTNLIERIPDRDAADKDIQTIYSALVMFEDYERCLREINNTLYHHGNERERLLARLSEITQ